jgi:hypothetical protein
LLSRVDGLSALVTFMKVIDLAPTAQVVSKSDIRELPRVTGLKISVIT